MPEDTNLKFEIGNIVKFKMSGEKAMVLAFVPLGMMGAYPMYDTGYIIRLSSNLQELYVRYHEVEKWVENA